MNNEKPLSDWASPHHLTLKMGNSPATAVYSYRPEHPQLSLTLSDFMQI